MSWDDELSWENYPNVLEEISNYIFASKYARYIPKLQRRETWLEAVNRVQDMHLKKFSGSKLTPAQRAKVRWAFDLVRDKKVLPSMRSMQFGGIAVEAHNARGYNCCVRHMDSIRAFAEVFYLLLCGCGVGLGVTKKHVDHIPNLVSAKDRTGTTVTYVVEDTTEGWADSIEALLLCYTKGNALSGRKIVFDYSRIRPQGAPLKTGGGKAPGYLPLKAAHKKIKLLLEQCIENRGQIKLRPIDVYDICMHTSDAVLAGGIRRSATIVIFDKDDQDMLSAKTGDWFTENPQRARSNNSVLLIRNNTSFEEFKNIMKRTKEWGEPGFIFAENIDTLFNPCMPLWAPILTPNGIRTIGDIKIGDQIWSETGWTTVINKWSTGTKKVFRYRTNTGVFYGTENRRLVSNGSKIEAKDCETIDVLTGPKNIHINDWISEDVMDGLVIGDGSRRSTNNYNILHIGTNDFDYHDSEISNLIIRNISENVWTIKTTILGEELPPLPIRKIPERFVYGNPQKVA